MENKKVIAVGALVFVLLILIVGVTVLSTRSTQTQPGIGTSVQPSIIPNGSESEPGQNAKTYTYPGTNGHRSFSIGYLSGWKASDLTAQHQARWLELTKGQATIIFNQEPTKLEDCAYPHDVYPTAVPSSDETIEEFNDFTSINTRSGQNMRVAVQSDYIFAAYACQERPNATKKTFNKLTSIGMVTLNNPEKDPMIYQDFIKIVSSLDISAE
ncbi:hypothetical protein HYS00_04095 [Candidatus Microgenomates bacterium]|nr:hypothetical protein [Candidatus Microgenomates bacterium]